MLIHSTNILGIRVVLGLIPTVCTQNKNSCCGRVYSLLGRERETVRKSQITHEYERHAESVVNLFIKKHLE